MRSILESSLTYKIIAAANLWIKRQWRDSRIIGRFLSTGRGEQVSENSVFSHVWRGFHKGLCAVFERLRMDKLLQGSIFTKPFIWSFLALALAPFLPTMVVFAMALVSVFTLILTFGCDRDRKLVYSPTNKCILLYAIIYIAATLTSINVSGSLRSGALTTFFIIFAVLIQNSVTSRRQLDILIYVFVTSGTVVSAYGVYQYVFGAVGASAWLDSEMFSDIGMRVFSTLGNPNVLAQYLLLVIPFAGACIIVVRGILPKLFFTGCLGALLLCMLLTFARGGWLGLIAATAVFLVMLDRRFILVGIVGLIVLYFTLPDVILDRFLSIGDVGDTSTSYRVFIWLGTIAMLRDFWFTGIGPGTEAFNRVYPLYSFNTVASPHSHNLYLQIMCDAGISGIIVFLATIFSYFRYLCSSVSRETDKSSKIYQIAAIAAVFGFLVQGFTDYSFYNYRVTFVFWAALGLGVITARRSSLKGGNDDY